MRNARELVTIFSTCNKVPTALAKSLLDSAGIFYTVSNEYVEDLFAWGRLGVNLVVGPNEVKVHPEDVEVAREMLKDIVDVRPKHFALPVRLSLAAFGFGPSLFALIVWLLRRYH